MSNAFLSLEIGVRALIANQIALNTAAHNLANASTPGYTRQRVVMEPTPGRLIPAASTQRPTAQQGTGVAVALIERVRDAFLDLQFRAQSSLAGSWDTRGSELAKVETVFSEPGPSGLSAALGRFWNAWQDVAGSPGSTAARTALVTAAETLSARIARDASLVAGFRADIDDQVGTTVERINDIAARIALLNTQIQQAQGEATNDLADQRDLLLDELSGLTSNTVSRQADGTVIVLIGGTDLVSGGFTRQLTTAANAEGMREPVWAGGGTISLSEGSLPALVELRDTTIKGYADRLDTLASTIADAVNGLHVAGFDAYGAAGLDFFTYTAGSAAGTLAVNAAIVADTNLVAAAAAAGAPGDGSVADAIAALRSAKLFSGNTQTTIDYYSGLVGRVGSDVRQASEMSDNQGLVMFHLRNRREEVSGVSVDEEAAAMVRYQRGYQAATRIISVADELLDMLINRMGAGR